MPKQTICWPICRTCRWTAGWTFCAQLCGELWQRPRRTYRGTLWRRYSAWLFLLFTQAADGGCRPVASLPTPSEDGGGMPELAMPAGVVRSRLYPPDWSPEWRDASGRFLPDFSYAGYKNGEQAIPDAPAGPRFDVLAYGADPTGKTDSTAAIQQAIDAAAAAGGGLVWLPAGRYRCDAVLSIERSGIVLRGAGPEMTFVYFTRVQGMSYAAHLTLRGAVTAGPRLALAEDAPARGRTVRLADASSLRVGDDVSVGFTISAEFIAEHGMTDIWTVFAGLWKPIFRRRVLAIDTTTTPHTVTLDVPLRYPLLRRDQAALQRESGYLSGCGVEQLSLANAVGWAAAWGQNQVHLLTLQGVKDGWVRGVRSTPAPASEPPGYHLQSSGILIKDSKRVTVSDCVLQKAQNRGDNGNGYLFEISTSSEILTANSRGLYGRHNFIQNWDFGASGLVWTGCTSAGSRSFQDAADPTGLPAASEYHHSLAMTCLVEQSDIADAWQAINRLWFSSGAGHTATQSVFWNNRGSGRLLSFQYGWGYVIGTAGLTVLTDPSGVSGQGTAPEDFVELIDFDRGLDRGLDPSSGPLAPGSLYQDQLRRRQLRGELLW